MAKRKNPNIIRRREWYDFNMIDCRVHVDQHDDFRIMVGGEHIDLDLDQFETLARVMDEVKKDRAEQ